MFLASEERVGNFSYKGGDPAAGSPTATLLRLHPNHQFYEEIALSINNQRDRARIIDAAFVKQRPVAPRKLFAVLGILAFTLILPVGVLFIKEQFIALKSEFNKR